MRAFGSICSAFLLGIPGGVAADPEGAGPPPVAEVAAAGDPTTLGFTADVGVVTIYSFRGLNLLRETSQRDAHAAVQPSLAWKHEGSGLSLAWWSSWQVIGANRGALVDAGMGDEQDLTLARSFELAEDLALTTALTAYVYPFADEAAAGANVPLYVEPFATFSYAGPVDLSLGVGWFHAVQEVLAPYRYAYVNPRVGRRFALGAQVALAATAGYGVKLAQESPDNVHDVQLDLAAPVTLNGTFSLTPAVHGAWSNLADLPVREELYAWASLNVTAGF